jgi:ubiquinone/menaquinone biosynthesis C-methylase UbiE
MRNCTVTDGEDDRKFEEAIRAARQGGMDSFQRWFNQSEDVQESLVRGYWDLSLHILTPKVCEYIQRPEEKVALEIGYGGGRILNAACSFFGETIGIDIHAEAESVAALLTSQGKRNFRLIRSSGKTIDVESESVDFIYSFIVLQHVPRFAVFASYVAEAHRCLKSGGVAQLYFGRYSTLRLPDQLRSVFRGYRELPERPIEQMRLLIRVAKARAVCKAAGFRVLEVGTSYKGAPDGYPDRRGGQSYVTLLKPGGVK